MSTAFGFSTFGSARGEDAMAPRSSKKKAPASQRKQQGAQSSDDIAEGVVQALGNKLSQLGPRKWKLSELEAALDKASGSLKDEGVRQHIQANLQRCAAQLHEQLIGQQASEQQQQAAEQHEQQQQQQQAAKRAKRGSKKAAAAAALAEHDEIGEGAAVGEEAAQQGVPLPSLATAAGYRVLAAGQVAGQPDARFSPAALLLARRLPGEDLVRAHVRRLLAGLEGRPEAEVAVAAARAALGICSALACDAQTPEDALRMFAPAVGQLSEAAQQLAQQQQQQQQGAGCLEQELRQLAGRALSSMHAALLQQRHALAGGGGSYWRANPQQLPPAAADDAACAASAAACALLTDLRLAGGQAGSQAGGDLRRQLDALATAAAADLRQLAPYAASGLLVQLAGVSQDEACGSSQAACRFLALYGGASKQEVVGGQDYVARLAAARKAAAVATHLEQEALAAAITAEACGLPVSQVFVGWLRDQPPSGIVEAALDASARGLDALSKHLVQECSERAVQGLLAAVQRAGGGGGAAAGGEAGGLGEGGDAAEEGGDAAMDDLLFFADKEGDATMFGRDWHMHEDDEEESADEEGAGGGAGLQLGSLPGGDADRRRSVDTFED